MTNPNFKVDFEPLGKRVDVPRGATLLEAARLAGLALTADCGGEGSCGQCRVIVRHEAAEALDRPNLTEQMQLSAEELAAGYRLACQAGVQGDVKVEVPRGSLIEGQRLQVETPAMRESAETLQAGSLLQDNAEAEAGSILKTCLNDRVIQAYHVTVAEPTLHDPRGDLERVLAALAEVVMAEDRRFAGLSTSPAALRALPGLLRSNNWRVQVAADLSAEGSVEISAGVAAKSGRVAAFLAPVARPLGLAVDLGTTKVAAYLVDIQTGEVLAAEGRPNPQIGYGEDVISRLGYAMNKPNGAETLSRAVWSTLAELAGELVARAGGQSSMHSTGEIVAGCIVGNTAMLHLLLRLPVHQLALAPYVPATAQAQSIAAVSLDMPFAPDAQIYIPTSVAGYVGADLVAMALASGIGEPGDGRVALGIDIGTNTEIILSLRGERLLSLSCASGPAFEGAHIKAGMRAAAGAIERVQLGDEDGARVQVIGDTLPVGICGSGIIDAVAEMRRVGIINGRGRLQIGQPGVVETPAGLEYVLVTAESSGTGQPIRVTQNDVDEIMFAKGAIKAGVSVLLEVAGINLDDLDEVVLAGAFGTYLNLDTATAIDLLPNIPLVKYRQVGNAAGLGAQRILVSASARQRSAALARRIEYVELSTYPGFRKVYAKSMGLK